MTAPYGTGPRVARVGAGDWVRRRTGVVPTAAPVDRRSDRTVLDEATRPTAAEPPPEVAFTARAVAAGRHLVAVHDFYRAELTQVRDVLRQVAQGVAGVGAARERVATMTLRSNAWTLGGLCQGHCRILTDHHTLESQVVFGHLRVRQADLVPVVDRLDAEHEAIHGVLEEIDSALIRLARDPTDLGPVTAALDLLTDTVLSHFAYEERELVGPLARYGFYPGQV